MKTLLPDLPFELCAGIAIMAPNFSKLFRGSGETCFEVKIATNSRKIVTNFPQNSDYIPEISDRTPEHSD